VQRIVISNWLRNWVEESSSGAWPDASELVSITNTLQTLQTLTQLVNIFILAHLQHSWKYLNIITPWF